MSNRLQLNSSFAANSLYWFCGLNPAEQGPTSRIVGDLQGVGRLPVAVCRLDLSDPPELLAALKALTDSALSQGVRPILHLDMHGDKDAGLMIGSRFLDWETLGHAIRDLNAATGNKLLVVGGACYALSAISTIDLHRSTPFFALLAPEGEVQIGLLEDRIVRFYSELFETGSLDQAFEHLGEPFRYIHCEKVLFIVLARYLKQGLMGSALSERRERLLTEVFLAGADKSPEALRQARASIKAGLKPTQDLVNRYAGPFLCNRPCSFTIDDLLELVQVS
jgi:hypothetical protein